MLVEFVIQNLRPLIDALVVFAVAVPLECIFGKEPRPAWSERLGNLFAMLVHFGVGLSAFYLFLRSVPIFAFMNVPMEPRAELLENRLVYAITFLFLLDGFYYWYHRFQHAFGPLWHIHQLHHTDPNVNVTTSRRVHFLELPLQAVLLTIPVTWMLGLHRDAMGLVTALFTFFLYFSHFQVNMRLGWIAAIFVGPQYHRIHHELPASRQQSNFAQIFPIWDLIGGTFHRPDRNEWGRTGVQQRESAVDRWRSILW